MTGATIALFGIGDLGGWILEFLTRSEGIRKIAVYDINETWGRSKSYCAQVGASYFGCYPQVAFQKLDLLDMDQTARALGALKPDVVAHHFHLMSLIRDQSMGGAPYFIKAMLGDRDVTGEIDLENALVAAVQQFPAGTDAHPFVASSFVKNILAIAKDTGEISHAAGPNGLPGGWPVRLSAKGAEVVLPQELDMQKAMQIVEGAQKFDGIERIETDGTIVLTEAVHQAMKEIFGYDCKAFTVEESEAKSKELVALLKKYKANL